MVELDTNKMKKQGEEIIAKSEKINILLDEFYTRIANMPTKTEEWVGLSAKEFARISKIKKVDSMKIKSIIYNYGVALIKSANEYEKQIKNSQR